MKKGYLLGILNRVRSLIAALKINVKKDKIIKNSRPVMVKTNKFQDSPARSLSVVRSLILKLRCCLSKTPFLKRPPIAFATSDLLVPDQLAISLCVGTTLIIQVPSPFGLGSDIRRNSIYMRWWGVKDVNEVTLSFRLRIIFAKLSMR